MTKSNHSNKCINKKKTYYLLTRNYCFLDSQLIHGPFHLFLYRGWDEEVQGQSCSPNTETEKGNYRLG